MLATGVLFTSAMVGMIVCSLNVSVAQVPLPSLPTHLPSIPKPTLPKFSLGFGGGSESEPAISDQPITIKSRIAQQWDEEGATVMILRQDCRIEQGNEIYEADKAVIWHSQRQQKKRTEDRVVMYLEGHVQVIRPDGNRPHPQLVVELKTLNGAFFNGEAPLVGQPATHDPLYTQAAEQVQPIQPNVVRHVQHTVSEISEPAEMQMMPVMQGPSFAVPGTPTFGPRRHVTVVPRNFEMPYEIRSWVSEQSVPAELITTIKRGVNIVIEGVPVNMGGVQQLGTIDLSADRAVIWTDPEHIRDLGGGADLDPNTPFQVYLEGNIVVRQGDTRLYATHAFYDIRDERGLLYNVDLRTFIPEYEGDVRVRATRVRQLNRDSYHAQDAWITGSQFGKPGYRLDATDIFLERRPGNPYPWTVDPNDPDDLSSLWVTSLNNRFLLGDVPIFYTPVVSAPAEDPQIPLRDLQFGQDRIFGTQIRTEWNLEALFGLNLPPNTDASLLLDYLSDRGPAIGGKANYEGVTEIFGIPTMYDGIADTYYIYDEGTDNLGLMRRNLPVPDNNRGRAMWRNRLRFPSNIWVKSEIGYISDRNFLEQYFEQEWDQGKDNETLLEVGQQIDNLTISGLARKRLNDFSNQTDWLREDLTILSEPLFGDLLTWSSHSSVGYGRIEPAQPPFNPAVDTFTPLPYYTNSDGLVAMTRHELVLPLDFGPLNVDPYLMGEAAHWGDAINGDDLSRLYGTAGVRASILFWKPMPWVQSRMFGLNGLAHKMVFDADYSISDATQDHTLIPQYNEFDDNAQERFRERFLTLEFGGVLPPTFEERMYAIRSGAGQSVTSPYHELVDDLHVLRLGWRHRLQTKVGPPDRLRIKDWMTLDLDVSYFPDPNRDNFGEDFGLFSTRYAWYVGERTTLLANSMVDFFDVGQNIWNVGVLSQRSMRGSVYLGFRQVEGGPIESQIVTASYSYAMSPKWVSSLGTAYDVAEGQDRGQSIVISRIGGDFIIHLGANYDRSKDNAGIAISIEPRLGHLRTSQTQLSSLLGIP
ncbi:MAG: hypothetical protein R3B91_12440 [Planctomycetaceae bacterium]